MSTHPHGPRSLPPQPTSFIGRQTELADIDQRLGDPACRLLTITGPGGVGKTRLAIEAAARQEKRFADGVAFVALQAVASAREIALAIAGKTGLTLPGGAEPEIQILTALQRRHALIVLDNFEHLLDAAPLLSELLRAAPAVTLLVTSREALRLQEEWRYPLHGLPAPDDPGQVNATDADALRLFAERARRARPDFSLEVEREAVARICRLVDGLPLAIELAAPWTAALPTIDIAAEIERDLSLLTTHLRNVPERHRSVRAIFEQTWHRLPDEERAVFRQLAVFRGGFQRDAASVVAGATLPILASLVARSLLRCEADGRYHLHELVRQYALEQLRADADALATTEARHRDYFMAFLADRGQAMASGRLREALGDIAAELDNVRIAWSQPLVDIDGPALQRAIAALANFYHLRGRYREGFALLEEMVRRLRERPSKDGRAGALAAALLDLGQFATRLGRFAEARAALDEARLLYAALDAPLPVGLATDPEIGLGVLELTEGNAAAAARLGETIRARATAEGNSGNLPYAWYLIAQAALTDGRLDEARQAAEAAAAAARRSGDDWFLAYCLNDLGTIAAALGNTSVARQNFQASLDLREAFDDLEGMAVGLVHLGRVAIRTGDFAGGRQCFWRAQMLYDDIGDRGGLAAALHGLGQAAAGSGEAAQAGRYFAQALGVAKEIGFTPRALGIVPDAAALLLAAGEAAPAELLLTVARHPAADRETRERARGLLSRAGQGHDPNLPLDEEQPGQAADPVPLVAQLQADLLALGERPEGQRAAHPPVQPLPDPLTQRELVVLRLIAGGRSNQQIADELFLAVSTVKWYGSQIFGKLAVRNRTEAVARARELAILP